MSRALLCGAVIVCMLQACVGDDVSVPGGGSSSGESSSSGGNDGDGGDVGESSKLLLSADPLEVVRGATDTRLRVRLYWQGKQGLVRVGLEGAPIGYQVSTPVPVAVGTAAVELPIAATDAASFGEGKVSVVATSDDPDVLRVVLEVPLYTRGAPGSIDTTFGDNGRAQLPDEEFAISCFQPLDDGGFLVNGFIWGDADNVGSKVSVARYDANGRLGGLGATGLVSWQPPHNLRAAAYALPESTQIDVVETRVTQFYSKNGVIWNLTAVVSGQGAVSFLPSTLSNNGIFVGFSDDYAVPSAAGALFVARHTAFARALRFDGSPDPAWANNEAQVGTKSNDAYSSRAASVYVSSSNILFRTNLVGKDVSDSWSGYVTIARNNGAVVRRAPSSEEVVAGMVLRNQSFVLLTADHHVHRVDGSGNLTELPGVAHWPDGWRPSVFELADGSLAVLATKPASVHDVRLQRLSADGTTDGSPIELAPINVNDLTSNGAEPSYAEQAFEQTHRRLVVYFRVYGLSTRATSPTEANPYWLIRRYWL